MYGGLSLKCTVRMPTTLTMTGQFRVEGLATNYRVFKSDWKECTDSKNSEAIVVGVDDEVYGERVAVAVVLKDVS
jgi:acyl-CoA synthetase (AMP-forming)/AMP-acid ligase II